MELILIRHAQPQWSEDGAARNDPGLSELGQRQAALVASVLATDGQVDELLVSTSRRAQETAEPIADAVDPTPVSHDWMHEIHFPPNWDRVAVEDIGREMEVARARPREEWWGGIGHGGESFRDFHDRVTTGLEAALAERGVIRHADDPDHLWHVPDGLGRIVMVAHAGTNSVVLGHLLGVAPQPWDWERFSSAHASITRLTTRSISHGHILSLELFSGVSHFNADEVTR